MKRSEIIIKNMQVKSRGKLEAFCDALETIEIECGIKSVKITLDNNFICPDIDLDIDSYDTPMQKLIVGLIIKLRKE